MMNQQMAHVGCLVCQVALGEIGKSYQSRVERWLNSNGPEWTAKRCKALWNAALLVRQGDLNRAQALYQENSIAYRKTDMTPKGPEGRVIREFSRAQRPAALKRISAVLRIYTSIRLDSLSKAQRRKALDSISMPSTSKLSLQMVRTRGFYAMAGHPWCRRAHSLMSRPLGQNEIHAEHLKVNSRYYSRNKLPKVMKAEPYASMAMSFMTEPWLPESLDGVTPCKEMRESDRAQGWGDSQQFAGRITVIQEQGAKARVVCQPSAWLQLAFMPLHNRLASLARNLFQKESCVEDQESGIRAAVRHMIYGHAVYCTDLSSATDRFPVSYSLGVLEALGLHPYADALSQVVSKDFECNFSPTGSIKYGAGQPMGLYGSFPLFHISNGLVAMDACQKARALKKGSFIPFFDGSGFKVLGDDIIFSDDEAERQYRIQMEELGVGISESKCFSGDVCEFAGFIALRTNKSIATFRPYKVPDANHITNPIQFLDSLGIKVKTLRDKRWGQRYDDYVKTISSRNLDLSPILPSWEDPEVPDVRGDNATLVRICQGLHMWAEDSGYTLPDPALDRNGKPTTRINSEPLFREKGMFDRYVFDREYLMSDAYRESEKHPSRRKPMSTYSDPLMDEIRRERTGNPVQIPRTLHPAAPSKPVPVPVVETEPEPLARGEVKPLLTRGVNHQVKTPSQVRRLPTGWEDLLDKDNNEDDFSLEL